MHPISDAPTLETSKCPRCQRNKVVHLKSMLQYDTRYWYKCDGCDHIFTKSSHEEFPRDPRAAQ